MLKALMTTRWTNRTVAALCAVGVGWCGGVLRAQAQDDQEQIVVVKAGRIITVSGDEISDGEIVIVDGKISLVGKHLEYPANAKIIDAPDETVIPGMVNAMSRFGLPNYPRSGVHGDIKVSEDVVLDDMELDEMLRAGFTGVAFAPPGSGIPGMAGVYRTAGRDDLRLINDAAFLVIHMSNPGGDKPALRGALQKAQAEIDKVEKARKEWDEKQAKAKADAEAKDKAQEEAKKKEGAGGGSNANRQDEPPKPSEEKKDGGEQKKEEPKEEKFEPPKIDPAYQHLVDMLQDKQGAWAMVVLSGADSVLHLQDLLDEKEQWGDLDLRYYVRLNGGSDIHYVLEQLADNEHIILTNPVLGNKPQTVTRVNLVPDLAYHGAEIALTPGSDSALEFERYGTRLADVVRSGWTRRAMLGAAISKPWELLGLGSQFGTIEKDKWGDLVFLDGDFLDPASRVTRVMIAGEVAWNEPLIEERK